MKSWIWAGTAVLLIFFISPGEVAADGFDWPTDSLEQVHAGVDDERVIVSGPNQGQPVQQGFTVADILRNLGIVAVVLSVVILLLVEFYYKVRIKRSTYRWLMLLGLFVLPVLVGISAMGTLLEETKTVDSCQSCHVMEPFVLEMQDPEGGSLASRHYDNKWIEDNQCYHCHTSYGVQGDLAAKRDGFRHWLLFVTETWPEPIEFAGSYPNQNCMACHGGTPKYEEVPSHAAIAEDLASNKVSCTSCHGPAHPLPNERDIDYEPEELQTMLESHGIN